MSTNKLMEALSAVSQEDLDAVNEELEKLETKADQLKELKRIIEVKLNLRKPQGFHLRGCKRKEKPAGDSSDTNSATTDNEMATQLSVTEQYRLDARRYIMANGPQLGGKIAKACDIPMGSITAVLKHKSFKQGPHGYELSGLS